MSLPRHNRFMASSLGRICMVMTMFLCLCVMLHMLGVPATLLDPFDAADTVTASVLEGFSVPSSLPRLSLTVNMVAVIDAPLSVHMPILASALFHPPPVL
jgi:hypothetical protein